MEMRRDWRDVGITAGVTIRAVTARMPVCVASGLIQHENVLPTVEMVTT